MTDQPDPDKKIIVDEDWKSQVQAEKEALRMKEAAEEAEATTAAKGAGAERPEGPLPPASLALLATTLATQAMVALGLVPNPQTEKAECRLSEARHFIDTLQVLQEKTEGNRTPEESQVLESLLHELRMGYITVQERQAAASKEASTGQS